MKLLFNNWNSIFETELKKSVEVRIICPFVSEHLIRKIRITIKPVNFRLITRFNLADFSCGVSSLEGLKFLAESGTQVFGIRDLHSKIYLFDNRTAIISSANLTNGGLRNNFECGVLTNDPILIEKLHLHFLDLERLAKKPLNTVQCEEWQVLLKSIKIVNSPFASLPDFGATELDIDEKKNYFIKFFGSADNRVSSQFSIRQQVEVSLCHYACCFSVAKRPNRFKAGDIVYMARMTKEPNDFAIFGKGVSIEYDRARDIASQIEIDVRPWKKNFPIYLRVKDSEFIDANLEDGVSMNSLIKALEYESFEITKKRYEEGERDINPRLSLSQQAYVKITNKAAQWVEKRFQQAIGNFQKLNDDFILKLPSSNL